MSAPCLRSVPLPDLVREIRRRCRAASERAVVRLGDELAVDLGDYAATWRGRTVLLRPRECDVLVALLGAHPIGLTPGELTALVWGEDADQVHARCYVRWLRTRLPGLLPCLSQRGGRYRLAVATRRAAAEAGEAAG